MRRKLALAAVLAAGVWNVVPAHAALQTGIVPVSLCPRTIDMSKQWNLNTPSVDTEAGTFSVGVSSGANLTGDCSQIAASVSGSLRAKIFNIKTVKPFEVVVTAGTNSAHRNSVTLDIQALGYVIDSQQLVNSDQPIQGGGSFGQMLPAGVASGRVIEGGAIPFTDDYLGAQLDFDMVGNLSGLYSFTAQPTYVNALFWGHLEADAHAHIVGDVWDRDGAIVGGVEGDGDVSILTGTVDGFGEFKQTNIIERSPLMQALLLRPPGPRVYNAWQVTGRSSYAIDDGLRGEVDARGWVNVEVKGKETIQPLGIVAVRLDALTESDRTPRAWELVKNYYKPFN